MADFMGNKKRLTINLSLFAPNEPNNNNNNNHSSTKSTTKSPKTFEPNGVVGLGIVAAMNELDQTHDPFFSAKSNRVAILAVSPRSTPIPIGTINNSSGSAKFGGAAPKSGGGGGPNLEEEEMELSEEYTCVISHIGDNMIQKREYFDDNLANGSESTTRYCMGSKLFSDSPPPARSLGRDVPAIGTAFQTEDFLNSCYLCKKKLHGLDIFMYRGEKAFCSADCRCKQISIDEHKEKEKCSSGVMKQLDYSVSPCSGPMQFFAGVAAA